MTVKQILIRILLLSLLVSLSVFILTQKPAPIEIRVWDTCYAPEETNFFPPDLNTAGIEALTKLPGIGPKTAEAIVAYRGEYGPFEDPRELILVPGIGEKKLSDILSCYNIKES